MAKQSVAGCGGWIVAGLLLVGMISQCGKDSPNNTNTNAAMAAGSTTAGEPSGPSRWLYVQADTLNCRATPGGSSTKVEALESNTVVREIEQQDGWSLLRRPTSDCWVKSSYLDDEPRPRASRQSYRPTPEPQRFVSSARSGSAYYANCSAARAAGAAPITRGEPGYARKLDRDGDGVACE
ncbi:excalibur calcium-binding domain-containing protein [Brevundimonas sp.]|uniref:excalibur calcium-binding domain-containing protein n=1 Tax=Brevundimonas sp. TaxID=1871086 RepID=UPI00289EB1D6|nr:excalibur calcium-binding domain-containing protein [Brevundimonas sp.]